MREERGTLVWYQQVCHVIGYAVADVESKRAKDTAAQAGREGNASARTGVR